MPVPVAFVLDLDSRTCAAVSRGLLRAGIGHVRTMEAGPAALRAVRDGRPRIVVVAPSGRSMDGLTLLRQLADVPDTAFFVIAAPSMVEDALDGIELGASAVLPSLADGTWSEEVVARIVTAELGGTPALRWREHASSSGTILGIGVLSGARLGALAHRLRDVKPTSGRGLFIQLDVPPWMVAATADRLHGSTSWRVLRAHPGDVVAARHVLLCSDRDDVSLDLDQSRPRIVRGSATASQHRVATTHAESRRVS